MIKDKEKLKKYVVVVDFELILRDKNCRDAAPFTIGPSSHVHYKWSASWTLSTV